MQIAVTNLTAQVKQAEPHEWEWLDGYLTFEREVFRKDKSGRMAHGVEEEKLLEHNGRFPAGMLSSVIPAAERADPPVTIEVVSRPVAPMEPDAAADVSWLRDYQREAFDRALALHRGILWMPTGSGKTECSSALMLAVRCKWLFLAHRTQLAIQAGERFTMRTGEPFGVCADGRWEPQRVTVATFQTLATALSGRSGVAAQVQAREFLATQQGVIADECHVASADTAALVLRALPNAYWRIGLSGTPLQRTDKRSGIAVGYLDRPIYRITTERLVAAGALAPPTIRMVRCLQAVNKPTYQGFYADAVVNSKDRNRVVVGLAASRPTPALVFVRQTKHGVVLKRILDRSGVDVRYVDGAAPLAARLAAVKWLEDRTQKRVLITTTIMQEGVDIPALETVIYASGGESPIAVLQSLGRGSRTDGGRKTSFEFWDVYDEAPRMSDDAVGKSWAADHAKNRAKAYAAEWGTVWVGPSIDGPWAELARPKEKK